MPLPISSSIATRKRTRSNNINETSGDHHLAPTIVGSQLSRTTGTSSTVSARSTNATSINGPPKRQRNHPPTAAALGPPPIAPRSIYSLRNRSITPDPRQPPVSRFPSINVNTARSTTRPRYNLRPRAPQSQIRLPELSTSHPSVTPRQVRRSIPPSTDENTFTSISPFVTGIHATPSPVLPTAPPPLPTPPPPLPPPPPPAPIVSSLNLTSSTSSISFSVPPAIPPRQYRLVYLSDDDDDLPINRPTAATAFINTTINLVTDDEDDEFIRPQITRRGASRSISGHGLQTRSRSTIQNPASAISTSSSSSSTSSLNSSGSLTTINTQDFVNGVAHVRLNRAIEIVIDSIQSLEGAVNNFDQLVLGLIYGPMTARTELESLEGMIRLSRILNLNIPARLSQEEIDALPKIKFDTKTNDTSSILLTEKCPICLTEFDDQETINKLHCTHLFHLQCISTWLSENDSCPTCRRKVIVESFVGE